MNETTKEALFQAQTAIQLVLELNKQKPDTGTHKYAESGDRVWRAGGEYAPQAGDKMPASDPRPATYGVDLDPMALRQLELAADAITTAERTENPEVHEFVATDGNTYRMTRIYDGTGTWTTPELVTAPIARGPGDHRYQDNRGFEPMAGVVVERGQDPEMDEAMDAETIGWTQDPDLAENLIDAVATILDVDTGMWTHERMNAAVVRLKSYLTHLKS